MKVNEILEKYTSGEMNLEESNKELKEAKAGFYLDPNKNNLTPEEIMNGTAGLVCDGCGPYMKVKIINGELMHALNEVNPDGTTNAFIECIVKGKRYEVKGKKLVELK